MQPDSPIRDRQSQSRTPGLAVAGIVQPIKGLKYLLQLFVGNARTGIEHAHDDFIRAAPARLLPLQSHFNRSALSSIPRGVPYDILDGAAQQVRVGFDQELVGFVGDDLAPPS